jgi:predicted esterase YcpF (UPF0227 family)
MNIMYLHGYGSSGKSSTVEYLKKALPNCYIYAPDIPVDPEVALPYLKERCVYPGFDIIIGTSMGAMYAQQLHEHAHYRICVNPAFHLSELPDILKPGTFDFFQPREDGQTQFTITEEIIQHFREMEAHQFDDWHANNPANLRCYGLFGTNDTTVNCRDEFASHYPNVQTFEGGHRMNKKIIKQQILPLVEELQNRISEACFQGQIEVCSRCPIDKEMCRMASCYANTSLCGDEFKKFIRRFLSEYERNKRLESGELVIAETNNPVVHIGDAVYGFSKDMRELYTGKVTKICQYIDSNHYTIEIKMERIIKYGLPTSMTVKMDGLFDYPRVTNDKYYLPNNLSDFVYLKKEDAVKEGLGYNEYILKVTQYAINEIKKKWGGEE